MGGLVSAGLSLSSVGASGQTPTTNPQSQAIPRAADGHPDFSGIWQAMTAASFDIQDHVARKGVPAGQGVVEGNEVPYLPAAAAKKDEHARNPAADPLDKCYLPGVPRSMYMPFPFQIVQTSKYIVMLFEYAHAVREVYMGSPHPPGHIDYWMGDSRGRWEGDTLVVDVIDFTDQTWFDKAGNFHSEALHLIERYTLVDADHIDYQVRIEDPKVFTKPWQMQVMLYRHKERDFQLLEYECYTFGGDAR